MRAVVQRVSRASVTVEGQVVGQIGVGLLVYVGVARGDTETDMTYVAQKVRYLRIFPDDAGKMNLDVVQASGAILAISNFTLLADVRQGRRPEFTGAAGLAEAEDYYNRFCAELVRLGLKVQTGIFRAMMAVDATNDGPINIVIDSQTHS